MKTKSSIFFMLSLALVAVFALVPDVALASSGGANVGGGLYEDVTGLFTGNIGTIVGLGLSLFGLWMWLVQQSTWGLIILLGGAALTAFPGIYKSVSEGFKNAFTDIGARDDAKATN